MPLIRKLLEVLTNLIGNSSKELPEPPKSTKSIAWVRLRELLKPYGIDLRSPLDYDYEAPSKADYERFLKWYKDSHPYDKFYNCDAFAWVMMAEALKWMHGKAPFGYVEASSVDENYSFPMHAFCVVVDWNENVWYCDELEVAAYKDKLYPAYKINCQDIKI